MEELHTTSACGELRGSITEQFFAGVRRLEQDGQGPQGPSGVGHPQGSKGTLDSEIGHCRVVNIHHYARLMISDHI